MTTRFDSVNAMRRLRYAALESENQDEKRQRSDHRFVTYFCNDDNIEDALSTLTEEFESLEIDWALDRCGGRSNDAASRRFVVNLINASWSLVRKYRNLMKIHQDLDDSRRKLSNDNTCLTNHVKRLKENVNKRNDALSELEERERRAKVRSDQLSRQLKTEKEESIKLRKQLQSKDIQHAHELRRIQQAGQKLCQQLEKSAAGTCKNIKSRRQTEMEKKIEIYEDTMKRLRDKNGLMLEEIKELRAILELHAGGIELQVEASGMWNAAIPSLLD